MKETPEIMMYAHRGPGMDHNRYTMDKVFDRPPFDWPGGAKVALLVNPIIEFFPFDAPLGLVPGGMSRPYPDYWNYTLRDYGNRVGIFRIIKALDRYKVKATAAFNAKAASRYPFLLDQFVKRNWEIMAMGVDMGKIHQGGVALETESRWAAEAVSTLRQLSGQPVLGWFSPAMRESFNTPDIVAGQGIQYIFDWPNDDLPYYFNVSAGNPEQTIVSLPHGFELSDIKLIHEYQQTPEQWADQVIDYFEYLHREAKTYGGRVLTLPLRPWLMGLPHRIAAVERVLKHITNRAGVWTATASEIVNHWRNHQENHQ